MNNKTSNITQQISNISRQMNKRLRIISPGAGGGRAGGSVSRDGGRDGHRRPAPAFQWSRDRCYRSWGYMWDAFCIIYLVICLLTWLYVCLFIMSARKLIWTFRKIFITPPGLFYPHLLYSLRTFSILSPLTSPFTLPHPSSSPSFSRRDALAWTQPRGDGQGRGREREIHPRPWRYLWLPRRLLHLPGVGCREDARHHQGGWLLQARFRKLGRLAVPFQR